MRTLLMLLAIFVTITSCGQEKPLSGRELYKNEWQVTGKLTDQNFAGGQVVAVALDGTRYSSRIGSNNYFGLALPGNNTLGLFFLSAQNPVDQGRSVAMLNFEDSPDVGVSDSLRLPNVLFNNKLSLGEVDIKDSLAYPTLNPSRVLDFDTDGISDGVDLDDQNDGLDDLEQKRVLEHLKICHFTSADTGETITIPLNQLFQHTNHGDSIKECRFLISKE